MWKTAIPPPTSYTVTSDNKHYVKYPLLSPLRPLIQTPGHFSTKLGLDTYTSTCATLPVHKPVEELMQKMLPGPTFPLRTSRWIATNGGIPVHLRNQAGPAIFWSRYNASIWGRPVHVVVELTAIRFYRQHARRANDEEIRN